MAGAVSWLKRAELPRKRTPGALSSQRTLPILRSGMRVRLPRGLGTPRRIDPGFPRSPGDAREGEGAHRPRRARTPTRSRVEPPRERGSPRTLRAVGGKGKGLCAIRSMGGRCTRSFGFTVAGNLEPKPQQVPRERAAREPLW